jgi:Tfp pilus assembly protein PilV
VKREGLALLEALVALVILSLLIVGYLRLFHSSHRLSARSREWSEAVAYAADAMERAKLELPSLPPDRMEELPGGWRRQVATSSWQSGLVVVRVTVALPAGDRLDLYRLAQAEGVASEAR